MHYILIEICSMYVYFFTTSSNCLFFLCGLKINHMINMLKHAFILELGVATKPHVPILHILWIFNCKCFSHFALNSVLSVIFFYFHQGPYSWREAVTRRKVFPHSVGKHPLGGKDSLKTMNCERISLFSAGYFP